MVLSGVHLKTLPTLPFCDSKTPSTIDLDLGFLVVSYEEESREMSYVLGYLPE